MTATEITMKKRQMTGTKFFGSLKWLFEKRENASGAMAIKYRPWLIPLIVGLPTGFQLIYNMVHITNTTLHRVRKRRPL